MIAHVLFLALVVSGDDAEAKRLFEAGGQFYERASYVNAIDAFEAAHRIAPRGVTAFSAAQAHRLQYFIDGDVHHLERAIELYRAYLELAPDGNRRDHASEHLATLVPMFDRLRLAGVAAGAPKPAPAVVRAQVIVSSRTPGALVRLDGMGEAEAAPASFQTQAGPHRIEVSAPEHLPQSIETVAVAGNVVAHNVELIPRPGVLDVKGPAGSSLFIDGQPAGALPLAHPIEVRAGYHEAALIARGHEPFVRRVDIGRGKVLQLPAHLTETRLRKSTYGLFAIGGALLLASGITAGLAVGQENAAIALGLEKGKQELTTQSATDPYASDRSTRDTLRNVAIATGVAGGLAGAFAIFFWIFDKPEAPAVLVVPVVGGEGAGVAVSGRF